MGMDTVTISRAEYDLLKAIQAQVAALQQEIDRLTEQIRLARKQRFGASSEKSQAEDGYVQLSYLFNEPECMARENAPEPDVEEIAVKAHARKARRSTREKLPEDIEVELIEKTLPDEECVCPQCQGKLSDIGKEVTKRLKIIPARFVVEETHVHKYACRYCQEHDIATPIKAADSHPPVIKGSIATPEAIAHIMTQKYVMYSPLYRQEQEYSRAGVPLSRQTMSNWLLKAASLWLQPVYERMKTELLAQDILHADETTLQVLHEPGKKAQSKSCMWLYRTGRDAPQQLVLYEYRQSRGAEHPETFLKDYRGYLHADGYAVYYGLPGVTVASCWAHVRRKFDEALQGMSKKDTAKESNALKGKQYCDSLFAVESEISGLKPKERLEQRRKLAEPILKEFHVWTFGLHAAPKSLLGSAVHYVRKLWPWLNNYLLDGRLEISNNRAERSIKPFVMGRKNFLFANVPKGAEASAVIYSLIETAKENGLDPYRYLTWLMHEAPMLDLRKDDQVARLMPNNVPDQCRARNNV
jgi:transposase